MNSKYAPETESEVLGWMKQVIGADVARGRENVAAALKDGQTLLQ